LADSEIIITCVSENEEFAQEVFRYLYDEFAKENQNKHGSKLRLSPDSLTIVGDEIHVRPSLISKSEIKRILESLLHSDPKRFKDYAVIELADTFTIGKKLASDSEQTMAVCEICGYFTPYEEEIYTHRMTHLAGFP